MHIAQDPARVFPAVSPVTLAPWTTAAGPVGQLGVRCQRLTWRYHPAELRAETKTKKSTADPQGGARSGAERQPCRLPTAAASAPASPPCRARASGRGHESSRLTRSHGERTHGAAQRTAYVCLSSRVDSRSIVHRGTKLTTLLGVISMLSENPAVNTVTT